MENARDHVIQKLWQYYVEAHDLDDVTQLQIEAMHRYEAAPPEDKVVKP